MSTDDIYKELCTSYRAIDDFRMKLLGFLPLASGGIFAFFIHPDFFIDEKTMSIVKPLLPAVGTFGFLVTLGLFVFEIFGIRKCTSLILVGAYLEIKQGSEHGQFADRPKGVLRFIAEPLAAGIIYPAVMATWIYFALQYSEHSYALYWTARVFAAFFLFMLCFIGWLEWVEIPGLEKSLGISKEEDKETGITKFVLKERTVSDTPIGNDSQGHENADNVPTEVHATHL